MKEEYLPNLHLPNDIRIAIGDVAAYWSFMEHEISLIIHDLLSLKSPKQGRIITTQMNVRPKLEMIRLLMEVNKAEQKFIDEFNAIEYAIDYFTTERNKVIHGLWAIKNEPGATGNYLLWYRGNNRNRIVGKAYPMTAKEIRFVAANIEIINMHLSFLRFGLMLGDFPPFEGKFPRLLPKPKQNRQQGPEKKKPKERAHQHTPSQA